MFKKLAATALGGCLLVAALCLGLLPVTALAAAPNGQVIYVGNENVTSGGYWTTDSAGNVTQYNEEGKPSNNYIHYNTATNTLTLHNATIKESVSMDTSTFIAGAAIGVHNQRGAAELTITLEGTNTIAEVGKGINVLANSTGGATLNITGDGSLDASASQTGIWVQSNSKNAALCVENAEVTASSGVAFNDGVLVQAKDGSDVSLTVNGGSLTASVNANIWFQFGSGTSGSGTPTVTVSNNAIVQANGGIANNSSSPIQYKTGNDGTGGIVFDGNTGTVYGKVELQNDLTISKSEILTIPEGSALDTNGNLANNGTVTIQNGGTLGGADTINNTGTINVENGGTLSGTPTDGTVVYAPVITANPTSQTVTEGEAAEFSVAATGENSSYQWQQSTGNGQSWTDIDGATGVSYATEATTPSMSGYQYRCVVSNSAGSATSSAATLTVNEHVHEWVVAWSWEGTKATATFTCEADATHQETPEVKVTSTVKTPATCTEAGVTTYTATVEFDGKTYTSTKDVADIPATGHEFEGGLCSVCGAHDASFSPALVSGDGAKWTKGSSKGLTFVSSAAFADLVEVRLDGRVLSASEYAVREGSTVVTLPAKLLEGLKAGDHELLIVSGSGTVRASLTVAEAAKVEGAAKTEKASADELPASGDSTAPALAVAVAAAAGAGLVLLSRRRAAR